ncbi:hypothetical protein CLV92_101292 [Kineococcus xinjiangensis]|uniref:Uncharacterized protein n=1 Tax=Kineococcus xinjiangensis TaxID=512762 RepID=A0A2S6IW87_9ACTN|nr:hypothetical protein [Kineococcus xinjiangensis]PPK98593.1 hypothetical protein CLV92_101292 [Kineococcus xinjiangensis]
MTFDLSALPTVGAPWEVTACIQEVCDTRIVQPADGTSPFFRADALTEDAVQARLQVLDASGGTVMDDTVGVTPVRYQPNGKGCEPIVWQAEMLVGADGVLRQVKAAS